MRSSRLLFLASDSKLVLPTASLPFSDDERSLNGGLSDSRCGTAVPGRTSFDIPVLIDGVLQLPLTPRCGPAGSAFPNSPPPFLVDGGGFALPSLLYPQNILLLFEIIRSCNKLGSNPPPY